LIHLYYLISLNQYLTPNQYTYMPQKTIFLEKSLINAVQSLAEKKGKKFSSMCVQLIEKGLASNFEQERFNLYERN
jgi:hypothetical protein